MKLQTKIVAVVIILAVVFFFGVPVVSSSSPGGVEHCALGGVCTAYMHFTESLSCYFEGGGPQLWAGTNYFDGTWMVGCTPPVT